MFLCLWGYIHFLNNFVILPTHVLVRQLLHFSFSIVFLSPFISPSLRHCFPYINAMSPKWGWEGMGWDTCNGRVRGEKLLLFRGEQGWERDGAEKAPLGHSWSLPGPSHIRWKAWESSTGIAARSVVGQGWSRGCAIHPSIPC